MKFQSVNIGVIKPYGLTNIILIKKLELKMMWILLIYYIDYE